MRKQGILAIGTLFIIGIVFIMGLLKVNMENTRVLAPLGVEYNENFEMAREEFGSDFEDFIRDNAFVKVYRDEDGILIKFGEINLKIKSQSELIEGCKEKISNIIGSITELF